jgi:hypothetical protein
MANVGDVLLPIAGGILGTSPYLGSGIRTALSVDEALGRRKSKEAKAESDQAEKEAKADADKAQAEKERLFRDDLIAEIEAEGGPHVPALVLMARHDPGKAAAELYKLRSQKEEEAKWTSERFGTVGSDFRGDNPDASFSLHGPLEGGGSASVNYPRPTVAESLDPHNFGWKGVNKDTPWIKVGTKEDGTPAVFIDEELKTAMAPYRTPEADETESKIMAAQIKVEKTKANLAKYAKNLAAPPRRGPDGKSVQGSGLTTLEGSSIFDDAGYKQRALEVQQAEAELALVAKAGEPEVNENSTDASYVDYDMEGNPIGGF